MWHRRQAGACARVVVIEWVDPTSCRKRIEDIYMLSIGWEAALQSPPPASSALPPDWDVVRPLKVLADAPCKGTAVPLTPSRYLRLLTPLEEVRPVFGLDARS